MNNLPLLRYSLLSLLSGIGGLDYGLHESRFQPIFCAEIDPNALATLCQWLSSQKIDCNIAADVTKIEPEDLIQKLELVPGELDLLAGGKIAFVNADGMLVPDSVLEPLVLAVITSKMIG